MSLIAQLKSGPLPYEPELAQETLGLFAGVTGPAADVICGMAGSSSYLRGLLEKEADWFRHCLGKEPQDTFETILMDCRRADLAALPHALRQGKRRVALLLATADLGGVWALAKITERLTEFAEFAVQMALQALVKNAIERRKLPGCTQDDVADCAGISVLAMGKMGAYELNYSSDIDLIVLFDETRHSRENYDDVRAMFLRITRDMAKMLSDATGEGYVFRTDLRLRPNPSVTPVCVPMDGAERYYESEGRTWERAAYIKARVCAGDIAAGTAFLERMRPFVWRKHLDFAAIQDAHDMRLMIRNHKGLGGDIVLEGHDMKLGRGGIREIEFFAQTQQLIAGGRDPDLRSSNTVGALRALAAKDWISPEVGNHLVNAYRAHRAVEHRIQMLRDAQTHKMPKSPEGLDQLARLCGWDNTDAFATDQRIRLQMVHGAIDDFFKPWEQNETPDSPEISPAAQEVLDSWAGLPALRSPRAVASFDRLRPEIEARIAALTHPDATLNQLDQFMRHLPAGVQLFALFESNPQILDLLLDICATAPGLATHLARNTGVFDAVLSGQFFEPLPDVAALSTALERQLRDVEDYESVLNTTRIWQKEQHFRIGVLFLRKLAQVEEVERAYSDLSEAVLQVILPRVNADIARRYGRFEEQELCILGMGKLGSRQMTASSDLDLILIYRTSDEGISDGKRGLSPSQYFARLTQALITAVSSPMTEGRMYEIDMRLRPSGRQGPVATSLTGFQAYQKDEAWTWEHMALTRARVVAGEAGLAADLEQVRREVLDRARKDSDVRRDVTEMRARLRSAKATKAGFWDVKDLPGGLMDMDLLGQMFALLGASDAHRFDTQMQGAVEQGLFDQSAALGLVQTHGMLAHVQQAQRLIIEGDFVADKLSRDGLAFILSVVGFDDEETLKDAILSQTEAAEALISDVLATQDGGEI